MVGIIHSYFHRHHRHHHSQVDALSSDSLVFFSDLALSIFTVQPYRRDEDKDHEDNSSFKGRHFTLSFRYVVVNFYLILKPCQGSSWVEVK